MAIDNIIPLRPSNYDKSIKKIDADTLTYSVLFGVSNNDAYLRFHPEFTSGLGVINQAGKAEARQFFQYAKHREYIDAYKTELEQYLSGKRNERKSIEIGEERKDRALKSLLNQAMSLVEGGIGLDADTIKVCSDIFNKLGLIKVEEQKIEPARRYLPVRCISECSYRRFVENHIGNGDIISECDYCRARKFAEDNGWKFDPTKNLDLPTNTENNG